MSRAVALAFIAGLGGGYLLAILLGVSGEADVRQRRSPGGASKLSPLTEDEVAAFQESKRRVAELVAENKELVERYEAFREAVLGKGAPATGEEFELPKGTVLPDGRIVGGAKFPEQTQNMFVGFMENFFHKFKTEAKLSPDKEEALRARMESGVKQYMQIMADFMNGDLTADQAYEISAALTEEGRRKIGTHLDENQAGIYKRFEDEVRDYVRSNIVSREITTLRDQLRLDSEQEKKIAAVLGERYEKVQANIKMTIPSFFFTPVRRDADQEIYDETGRRIRELLRPDQADAFDKHEREANDALNPYRRNLVPK
jgi:hypothetical protein